MFSKNSTSRHSLNSDRGLSLFNKINYLLLNYLNNLFPLRQLDLKLEIKNFVDPDLASHLELLDPQSSPSRAWSDLFWLNLPWDEIRNELGEINVFDAGCGSGGYGERLVKNSRHQINSYKGIDIKENKNWSLLKNKYPFFQFNKYNGSDVFSNIPPSANFIITQSAIEHFENDLSYFEQTKEYIQNYKQSVIQVHLFPSAGCLKLYLWHGVRQYTPRNISKISRIFSPGSRAILYKLGGPAGQKLHADFITKPLIKKLFNKNIKDWRQIYPEKYRRLLFQSLGKDMSDKKNNPSFYALVIHSYGKNKVF